jgi:hypothetical protein
MLISNFEFCPGSGAETVYEQAGFVTRISPALSLFLRTGVLFPGTDESPNFIALQTAHFQASHVAMMVSGSSATKDRATDGKSSINSFLRLE